MVNFFKVFFIVLIQQIIFVITFSFTIDKDELGILFLLLLLLYLGMYFKNNEIYELKISKKLFKLFFIPSWIVIGGLVTTIAFWLVNNGILPDSCGGTWICISNYILLPIFLVLFLIVLGGLELIIFIVKKISKKIK